MNEKDRKLIMAVVKKRHKEVTASKEAARIFFLELDLITPTGRWKRAKTWRPFFR